MTRINSPVLLFDVMNTLVRDPFHEDVPAAFGLTLAELLPLLRGETWIRFELGELTEQEFFTQYFRDGRAFDTRALTSALERGYAWLPDAQSMLSTLKAHGSRMHLFSNYPVWYRRIEAKLGLSRFAPWSFVSCEQGVRKPSPTAFARAQQQLGVAYESIILIDDCAVNCAAAEQLGMRAILARGTAGVLEQLGSLGVDLT